MKALSVRQPWASLIASGEKTVELRGRRTKHRGPLIICSSQKGEGDGPKGVTLCEVDVIDCRPVTIDDAVPACVPKKRVLRWKWAWEIRLNRIVDHHSVRGQLGIFNLPETAQADQEV